MFSYCAEECKEHEDCEMYQEYLQYKQCEDCDKYKHCEKLQQYIQSEIFRNLEVCEGYQRYKRGDFY